MYFDGECFTSNINCGDAILVFGESFAVAVAGSAKQGSQGAFWPLKSDLGSGATPARLVILSIYYLSTSTALPLPLPTSHQLISDINRNIKRGELEKQLTLERNSLNPLIKV